MITITAGCSTFLDLDQGEEFFYQGDFESAEMYFTRVIEAKDINSYQQQRGYLLRSEARLALGQPEKALADIKSAIALFASVKGFYLQGRAHQQLGKFIEAEADFNRVIEMHVRETREQRPAHLVKDMQTAHKVKLETTDLAGYSFIALGEIYLYQEKYAEAIEHFNSAVMVMPKKPKVFFKRSGAYQLIERKQLAAEDYQRYLALDGDPNNKPELVMGPLLLKNALAQYAAENYSAAVSSATQALEHYPGYLKAAICRAHSYAKLGRHKQAVEDFSFVLGQDPGNIEAHIYRAFSFNELGQYDLAKQDTSFVLAHEPNNLYALFHQGFSHIGQKAYINAAADFSQIIENNPNHEQARIYRGVVRRYNQDMDGAGEDFQAVIDFSPNHQQAHYLLALTRYQQHKYQAALAVLSKAITLAPNSAKLFHLRGLIYFDQGKKKKALAAFEKAVSLEPENGKFYLARGMAKSSLGKSAADDYALANKFIIQQKNKNSVDQEGFEGKIESLVSVEED